MLSPYLLTYLLSIFVDLRPMTHAGSSRMYLDPDVVPPMAGFRLYTVKKVIVSTSPARLLSLARNISIIPGQKEFG